MQTILKRTLDVLLSALLLVVSLPAMVIIALAIKFDSPGPVFYRWRVAGQDGRPFLSWKFRSMCADADQQKIHLRARNEMRGPAFKLRHDPRVTAVGRWLRRYSLDE
jgi:lipopolysaccharide/colanic/teichoic acid biosynthesis glycosyltransferase